MPGFLLRYFQLLFLCANADLEIQISGCTSNKIIPQIKFKNI